MGFVDNMKKKMQEAVRESEEKKNNPLFTGRKEETYGNKIGKKEIQRANEILNRYKGMKKNLESKLIANEEWWKLRYWQMENEGEDKDETASGWLFNCIISKHADAMDAYPEPNMLPREADDMEEAKSLSEIVPVVLKQAKMRKVYSDVMWYKLIQGTGVFGIFWDRNKLNGLGDISIQKADLMNLYWDMGVADIQESKHFFNVRIVDNEELEAAYPQVKGKLKTSPHMAKTYLYEENIDLTKKSLVVDWYYKRPAGGRSVLHYVKYTGNEVLYATENMPELSERGLYDHGMYPFVFDKLFPVNGLAIGFGYVDVCKRAQKQIDLMNSAILKNSLMASTPRYFIRQDGAVNEEEFADWKKDFVHVDGMLGEDSIRQVQVTPLSGNYITILNNKIEELKETSGNRDVNNGGAASGVTAASAIAAMQEQSGKTSRDSTTASYDAYEEIINLIIELIRQFYDVARKFRITGEQGEDRFVDFSNRGMLPQSVGKDAEGRELYRLPVFDIEINAQKANPYSKLSQNEFALELYSKGFFNPDMCDQALACLKLMDFNHKEDASGIIEKNGTLYQKLQEMSAQMAQMAEIIDSLQGSSLLAKFNPGLENRTPSGGKVELDPKRENAIVEGARQQAQEASQPR